MRNINEIEILFMLRVEGLCQRKAEEGDRAFQKMIDEGHLEHYQKELHFIREHGTEWSYELRKYKIK
ncbi:hypothetical protein [Cytobacillus oceanisediminis]|uniref:hypothetical protein n=1 Tax=Cytobacillus oceanisediminis TaxID=665099 RepID=UPI003D2F5592